MAKEQSLNKLTGMYDGNIPVQLIEVKKNTRAWMDAPASIRSGRVYRIKYLKTGTVGRNVYGQDEARKIIGHVPPDKKTIKPEEPKKALKKKPPPKKKSIVKDELDDILGPLFSDEEDI